LITACSSYIKIHVDRYLLRKLFAYFLNVTKLGNEKHVEM
jgi:hypothetical protein